ncbi:MAG: hypothetical protein ACOCWR_04285 [Oceanidesulfovibrio sp.]
MVPCHVCGKDASAGWIYGIPPAPDRQKIGLCPEHDSMDNRRVVRRQWIRLMEEEAARAMARKPEDAKPAGFEVEIDFLDGGRRTIQSLGYEVLEQKDLLAISMEGEAIFYPMQHIRAFHARPLFALPHKKDAAEPAEPRDASGPETA